MDEWRGHGGRRAAARAAWGGAPADWLDLSTGINPHPWPGADTLAIDWHALPEPEDLARLEASAARRFGVDPARVCAAPGSELALRLLGTVLGGDAVHVAPGYRTHAEAFAHSRPIAAEDLEEAARAGRTILLADPNNPDGRRIAGARLLDLARTAARAGGRLIVDEAFADSLGDGSLAAAADPDLPLVVLRSFGKMFGLAGLRLGFVIAPPPILAACRTALGGWPVSAAAIAIGTAAYGDSAWIDATREQLAADAAALDAVLRRHGLEPIGACPLFRLVRTPDAAALFERLARRHILTRPFDYRPDWLRIGLPGDAAALARLDAALGDG